MYLMTYTVSREFEGPPPPLKPHSRRVKKRIRAYSGWSGTLNKDNASHPQAPTPRYVELL